MMQKKLCWMLVLLMLVGLCAACGQEGTAAGSPAGSSGKPVDPPAPEDSNAFAVTEAELLEGMNQPLMYAGDPPVGRVVELDIKDQMVDNENKTAEVRVTAKSETVDTRATADYVLSFRPAEKGWAVQSIRRELSVSPVYEPLMGVDQATADKEYNSEGATMLRYAENLSAGMCSYTYQTVAAGKYATITKKETLHYRYDSTTGKWAFHEKITDEQSGDWNLNGLWVYQSGSDLGEFVQVTVAETGADYLHVIVNAQGEGGIIYDGRVDFDPASGTEYRVTNPYDSWDSFDLCVKPNSVYVSRTASLSKKNSYLEREDLLPPEESAVPSATEFTYTLDQNAKTAVIRSYKGSGLASLTIPATLDDCAVVGIDEGAFYNHDELKKVFLPETVTFIGDEAFRYCDNLNSIHLPEGLTSIGSGAFRNCRKLFNFRLPESLQTLGSYAFADTGFDAVTLPAGITELPEGVFYSSGLRTITYGPELTKIGAKAFEDSLLHTVTIPGGVRTIEESAFEDCDYLKELTIEDGVEVIGAGAFYGTALTEVILPDSVREIGKEVFRGSTLKSIHLSPSIQTIPWCAFNGCQLETLIIPDGVTVLEAFAFNECGQLNIISLPASLTSVGERTFDGNSRLTTVHYAGTEADWKKIQVSTSYNGNRALLEATIKYESQLP